MKRRYQIDRERAVRRFEQSAAQDERGIQLPLPLKEIAAALQDGVGALMRQAGLELMQRYSGHPPLANRPVLRW